MTLEEIYYIGQTVAVIAIFATLVAVVWQGHQAAIVARAELTLNAHLQNGMIHRELADTPEKAELMVRLLNQTTPLSPAERVQILNIVGIAIGAHEALFSLRIRGLIEEPIYRRLSNTSRQYMQSPNARRLWKTLRTEGSDPRFIAEIDEMVAGIDAEEAANASALEKARKEPA
jgi:hypothetical protein